MKYLVTLLLNIIVLTAFSGNGLWEKVSGRNLSVQGTRKIIPSAGTLLKLDDATFKALQPSIPEEQSGRFVLLSLPSPDGTYSDFKVFESVCMEKELADRYPSIKTYHAVSVEHPFVTAKLDYTEFGFHAMVLGETGTYYIDPYSDANTGFYNCYYKKDYTRTVQQLATCETPSLPSVKEDNSTGMRTGEPEAPETALVSTGVRRTFRLALAGTVEYSAAVGGATPTKASVLSAMVTSVNRVNGIFEKDLSIHLNLVAKNDTLIFITSDSYTNNNGGTMLGQNQTICDNRIGNANYDIGHVFSTGGGGIAELGAVCQTGSKARGVTGSPNPVGDSYDVDYVIHEMGHQFGANHTFNGNTGNCGGGNRNNSTAYEPGSGTTVMAYAGICDANDIAPHSDDYFHRASIVEIYNYISGTSCAVTTNPGNTAPTVTSYVTTYYIPYKTSFEVTASATDPNGRPLNYCWEEYDLGPAGSWNSSGLLTAPLFRSFNPSASGTRVFPKWDSLITNGIKFRGEVLPETTRDVKLRCTVRNIDNNGYGSFNAPDNNLLIKSVTTTSLFRVSTFATSSVINGNTSQTIAWDVAGTTTSPISCANVDILLSLDSARTFPYVLASNTPNDGSESVLIPNVFTANPSAKIKVKGSGNVFFDLNNGWIKINQVVVSQFTSSDTAVCKGASVTFTNSSAGTPDSVRWTIGGGTPSTSTSQSTVVAAFNTAGTYTISLVAYKSGVASPAFTKTILVKQTQTTNISRTICDGESVTVGSDVFTATGNYITHLQTSLGCDSTVNLSLQVNPKKTTNISRTICDGESVTVGSDVFTATGNYVTHLQTSLGCDSTVNLSLQVNPKKTTNISRAICDGESVTVGSDVFTATGNYVTHLQTSLGCDSTVNLRLQVNPKKTTNISRTICDGESVTVGSDVFTATGNYVTHLQTSLGCDSTVNLSLQVNPKKTTNISRTICDGESVTVGSDVFTATGNYVTHLQTSLGCDSTVNLSLQVNPKKTTNISRTICDGESVTIGSDVFTANGDYVTHLQTTLGCDSTVNLNLSVQPLPSKPAITQSNDTLYSSVIIAGASYLWYKGAVLTATTATPFYKLTSNGVYTLKVSSNDCVSEVSVSFNASLPTGIRTNKTEVQFSVIPNPNTGVFEARITASKSGKYNLVLYNVAGQEMVKEEMNIQQGVNSRQFNLDAIEKGVYFITLSGNGGVSTQNIIVQ